MTTWNWNGARWWKFDFHTHTPASEDYGKGSSQDALKAHPPREWLLDFMRAGIDCVAVTDHNSGAWVDRLKQELVTMASEQPDGYRELVLFPGVEISINGGVHLLAILDPGKTTSDIDSLLGAAGFSGTKGSSDAVTTRTFSEVVAAIENAGGIAVPAHVDKDNGLFGLSGTTLDQALGNEAVFAMEVVDQAFDRPQSYTSKKISWTEVLGSDAHHPSGNSGQQFPGSHFTWVKMGSPCIEGLRLALLDGELSVRRSDCESGNPNDHAALALESIEITSARYMGRANPFTVDLNPWLNAVIGGRGTGKSTLVEFLRIVFRRTDELPEDLRHEFEKYKRVYPKREDGGLLTNDTVIAATYRKDGSVFRIQWNPQEDIAPIQQRLNGEWEQAEGDIRQRFPIRVYSQKQIFYLASRPSALLGIVDEAPDVDRQSWEERWKEEETRYMSLRARIREIETGLAEEARLRGELDDVTRKLSVFEEAGHADVLKAYQHRTRQSGSVETWEETWSETGDSLREAARELLPDDLDEAAFDEESEEDKQLLQHADAAKRKLEEIQGALNELADRVDTARDEWRKQKSDSKWKAAVDAAGAAYEELKSTLAEQKAGDPNAYGQLVTRRQEIEKRLKEFDGRKKQAADLESEANTSLNNLLALRRELTRLRTDFLDTVLGGNKYVDIRVVPYGAREAVEQEFRELIQRSDGGFEKDIGSPDNNGLLGGLYAQGEEPENIEQCLSGIKEQVRKIAKGDHAADDLGDQRFATHLAKLNPEVLDRLDIWFPEDTLEVRYSPTGDGQSFRSIQEGSPGQKTAALLAFLLSYGEEPLILDQPEDDLDNHLIYDLIVAQLREVKRKRQIIVVTHNANIVVNGDAEMIAALAARGGETQQECLGSLQERKVRDTICDVMEGGRTAFEQRYRRIALEARNG